MLIQALAQEVHQNAVEHGWWDEERGLYEIIALIHSEWSEALEEARADMPMAYIQLKHPELSPNMVEFIPRGDDGKYTSEIGLSEGKSITGEKPEGIAVELIDGVIRILDYYGKIGAQFDDPVTGLPSEIESLYADDGDVDVPDDVPTLITLLHAITSRMVLEDDDDPSTLIEAMGTAMMWVKDRGIDPLALLLEKHAYNKTRPYKHGKKF